MQLFNVRYEPLCVVELQHEYYTQKEFADFQLQPSTATANLMRQYGILLKQVGNKIYLLVQAEQMRPKRIFDKPLCWSFYIHIKNGYFTNFTNTRLGNFREHVYYFNNLNSNVQDNTAFLSQKITPFQKMWTINGAIGCRITTANAGKPYKINPHKHPKPMATNGSYATPKRPVSLSSTIYLCWTAQTCIAKPNNTPPQTTTLFRGNIHKPWIRRAIANNRACFTDLITPVPLGAMPTIRHGKRLPLP